MVMRLGRRCHGLLPTPQKAGPAPREGLNLSGRLQCTVRGWRGIRGLHVGCELGQVAVSVLQSFVAFVRQKACRPQHFLLVKRFDPMIRCAAVKSSMFSPSIIPLLIVKSACSAEYKPCSGVGYGAGFL